MINWNDTTAHVTDHFTVHDLTFLPSWRCHHLPSDAEKANLVAMAMIMEKVRTVLGKPINIHCWIRPTAANCPGSPNHGGNYNLAAGSTALHSAHITGNGVDFDCGENCDVTRAKLEPLLAQLGVCMEKKPGSTWVHLDDMPPRGGTARYFIP